MSHQQRLTIFFSNRQTEPTEQIPEYATIDSQYVINIEGDTGFENGRKFHAVKHKKTCTK